MQPLPGFILADSQLLTAKEQPSILLQLAADQRSRPRCSCCEALAPGYDTQPERRWEYVPLWNLKVSLAYAPRRVQCPTCGVKVEQMPWNIGKHTMALAMILFVANWSKLLAWKAVAERFRVSWEHVYRSVEYVVEWGLKHRELGQIEAIGVDELHWSKRMKSGEGFITLIYQIDAGKRRLIWAGTKRTEATLREGLKTLGSTLEGIKFVCSDMCKAYVKVIAQVLPKALNILDKFHIVAHLNKAVDEVRRSEVAQLRKSGNKEKAKALKGGRWVLLRPQNRVKGAAKQKLHEVIGSKAKSANAWIYKEAFAPFWDYKSVSHAMGYLDSWCRRVMRSRIEPMKRVAKMLRRHEHLLRNYFIAKKQYTSAAVEGLNLKCNLVKRRAYGLRTSKALITALYHTLGDLPEPKITHRFC